MSPIVLKLLLAFLLTVQVQGNRDGNKLEYAEPDCLAKLAKAMEQDVSKIVRATSDIQDKDERQSLGSEIGRTVHRVTKNSVQRNISVQDAIISAVNGANPNPTLDLGEAVRPVIRSRLQTLCVKNSCCYT